VATGSPATASRTIDAHVHLFSDAVRREPERFFARDAYFGELYRPGKVRLASADELIADMDVAGVDAAVAVGWGWRELDLCRQENDYLIEAAGRYPGRLAGLAAVAPLAGAAAARELERCLDCGLRGAGELMPDGQGFALDDPAALAPIVELLRARDGVLLTHTSEPAGHRYPGKGSVTPGVVDRFLGQHPGLRVVLAHFGGGLPFYELMPEVRARAVAAVYDSAAAAYLYDWSVFRTVVELAGAERVLFGTDSPLSRPERYLRAIRALGLPEDVLAAVLGGNAARVFRLGEAAVPAEAERGSIGV